MKVDSRTRKLVESLYGLPFEEAIKVMIEENIDGLSQDEEYALREARANNDKESIENAKMLAALRSSLVKMNPRLPKEGSLDGVLNVKPDPPTMNAGMPRGNMLDAIKTMNAREMLMDMGPSEVMRLLGDAHEGDYRHLFDAEKPHAFRHGIQDAGADEIMQLLQELDLNKSFDTAWNVMKDM